MLHKGSHQGGFTTAKLGVRLPKLCCAPHRPSHTTLLALDESLLSKLPYSIKRWRGGAHTRGGEVLKGKRTDGTGAGRLRSAPLLLLLAQGHLMVTCVCTLGGGEGFGDHRSGHASALPQPESPPPDLPAHPPPWWRWASCQSALCQDPGPGTHVWASLLPHFGAA